MFARREASSVLRRMSAQALATPGSGSIAAAGRVFALSHLAAGLQPCETRAVPLLCSVASRGFAAKAAKGGKKKGGRKDDDDDEEAEPPASSSSGGKGKGKGAAPATGPAVPAFDAKAAKGNFQDVVDSFEKEMSKLRASRASPGMLALIDVPAYEGNYVPLQTLGTISARDAQTLTVMLYDPGTADAVQKAIMGAKVSGSPRLEGEMVVVPVPALTNETRNSLLKMISTASEGSKAHVRRVRKDLMDALKKGKDAIGEDELKRREKEVQIMTDAAIKDVETLTAEKEKDIRGN